MKKRNLKIFFSRTTGPVSSTLGTKHPWVRDIQVCSNEGSWRFLRGDNYKIAKKKYWRNLKIFSRIIGPIATKLGTKHPWAKRMQCFSNEGSRPFLRGVTKQWKKTLTKFEIFSRTTWPILSKLCTKHPYVIRF